MNAAWMKVVGDEGVFLAAATFARLGYLVSWPLQVTRYDLLVDDGKRIKRVQVKSTAAPADAEVLAFRMYTKGGTRGTRTKFYGSYEIDGVVGVWLATRRCFWFDFARDDRFRRQRMINLRLAPARTKGNQWGFRWATDYELGGVAERRLHSTVNRMSSQAS